MLQQVRTRGARTPIKFTSTGAFLYDFALLPRNASQSRLKLRALRRMTYTKAAFFGKIEMNHIHNLLPVVEK